MPFRGTTPAIGYLWINYSVFFSLSERLFKARQYSPIPLFPLPCAPSSALSFFYRVFSPWASNPPSLSLFLFASSFQDFVLSPFFRLFLTNSVGLERVWGKERCYVLKSSTDWRFKLKLEKVINSLSLKVIYQWRPDSSELFQTILNVLFIIQVKFLWTNIVRKEKQTNNLNWFQWQFLIRYYN